MDFISDELASGRKVRGLTIIDVFSRYCPRIEFDYSLTGKRVIQTLEEICTFYGHPQIITVDNGPEFICMALDKWAYENNVKLKFSRRGKPTDNAFIESFNGKVRDEFLNVYCFKSIMDMKYKAGNWID